MRLIDAENLAEVLNRYLAEPHVQLRNCDISVGLRMGINTCLKFLNNANTIEAEPVRHGRWEKWNGDDRHHCTVCECYANAERDSYGYIAYEFLDDYCPNCGADMREKEGE